ncbi:oligosaccharide flippase family protein [Vibrio metschnikovii]|nr:oligosaccharide flippase family protein [Vibrio metschnikovii]
MIILKILASNFTNAFFSFASTFLVATYFSVSVYADYAKIINYSLILLIGYELGFSVFVVVKSRLKLTLTKMFYLYISLLFLVSAILITISVGFEFINDSEANLLFLINLLSFGMAIFKVTATYCQSTGDWNLFSIANSMFSIVRFAVILAVVFLVHYSWLELSSNILLYSISLVSIVIAILFQFLIFKSGLKFKNCNIFKKKKWVWLLSRVFSFTKIAVVITLAMRIDIVLADFMLSDSELASYAIALQFAFIFPLVANSYFSYYLKEKIDRSFSITQIGKRFIIVQTIVLTSSYIIFNFLERIIFLGKYPDFDVVGYILIFAFCGGIFFTPYEAYLYKKDSSIVFKIKSLQLASILIFSPLLTFSFSLLGLAFGVLISRVIGWAAIYAFMSNKEINQNI